MVGILDALQRLETKFDYLTLERGTDTSNRPHSSPRSPAQKTPLAKAPVSKLRSGSERGHDTSRQVRATSPKLTVPHKVLLWPSVYSLLENSGTQAKLDLQSMSVGGTPWLIKQDITKHPQGLPFDVALPTFSSNISSDEARYSLRVGFPTLTGTQIQSYTKAYFNTFNVIHPILDYDVCMIDTLGPLLRSGFGYGDPASVLALLVFALGQLAIDGITGGAISNVGATPSGIRGGTLQRPPGLNIFNEARARIGYVNRRV